MTRFGKKKWFIWLNGQEKGPYSFAELRSDPRITPDTLARREDSQEWKPIRMIEELQDLYKDSETHEEKVIEKQPLPEGEELTLDYQNPSPFWLWLIVILMVLLYIFLTWN